VIEEARDDSSYKEASSDPAWVVGRLPWCGNECSEAGVMPLSFRGRPGAFLDRNWAGNELDVSLGL
jgi:hypothetical protein